MKRFVRNHPFAAAVLATIALAALSVAPRVLAQAPSQLLFTPTGKELIELTPPGSATLAYVPLSVVRDGAQYLYNVPLTGFAIVMTAEQSVVSLNPAGTLAAGTITMPPTLYDGKIVSIFSSQTITALTLNTSNSATFVPAVVTTLAAGASVSYVYDKANNQWHRFQ
jgi:hypothetical protein